ncbi:TetR/AcrR family transcriptional regulator [Silvibacterium sp.]|uniref:TetR/AcrR family transcriptional regulator n=1 Tax=Silvibacterium sp. TaxID=1964179 RepID=UPI0039E4E627
MRRSRAEKAVTHSKILSVAAKRFRERGLQGIGVADVMKDAGTSVGNFYKHFDSRDDLVMEALAESFKDLDTLEETVESLSAYMAEFMSDRHRDAPATGCPITAFAGEMAQASDGVRAVYTQRVKRTLGYYADHLKGGDAGARHARAILMLSAGIGALSLSRAVNDKALSREILTVLRKELTGLAERPLPAKRTAVVKRIATAKQAGAKKARAKSR